MILCIKTDQKEAYVAVRKDGETISEKKWEAHKELSDTLLRAIEEQLSWSDISGIILFKGPGSFTGLRIGATVANTLANAQTVPIVGEIGETWIDLGEARLANGENDQIVAPEYGGEANITKPRK